MLPATHRVRRSADFAATIRGPGAIRVGGPLIVVHAAPHTDQTDAAATARVGFVVSKAVGNAVQRNLVKRRLRAIASHSLDVIPAGTDVVVRALPDSSRADFAQLEQAWDRQIHKVAARLDARA